MNKIVGTKRTAGLLLFIGASQFFIAMLIAEALYPNYNIAKNMISDLGVGPTAPIFNSSIIILGGLILITSSIFQKCLKDIPLTVLILFTGFGAIGVGLFEENTDGLHEISAGIIVKNLTFYTKHLLQESARSNILHSLASKRFQEKIP